MRCRLPALFAITLAAFATACSDPAAQDAGAPSAAAPPAAPRVPRCTSTIEMAPDALENETPAAVAAGPNGVTVFTAQHVWNGESVISIADDRDADEDLSAVATSQGYIMVRGRTVSLLQRLNSRRRTTATLPASVAGSMVFETSVGPMLGFIRPLTTRSDDDNLHFFVQALDENGRPQGSPLDLSRTNPALADANAVDAHEDTGRIVVEVEHEDGQWHYSVLDRDLQLRANGEGNNVFCPLAGCLRIVGHGDPMAGVTGTGGDDRQIRGEIMTHGVTIPFGVLADHVEDAVVNGNRVLVALRLTELESANRAFAIIDVARREAVLVRRGLYAEPATSWPMSLDKQAQMRATADGFVMAYRLGSQVQIETITCDR